MAKRDRLRDWLFAGVITLVLTYCIFGVFALFVPTDPRYRDPTLVTYVLSAVPTFFFVGLIAVGLWWQSSLPREHTIYTYSVAPKHCLERVIAIIAGCFAVLACLALGGVVFAIMVSAIF